MSYNLACLCSLILGFIIGGCSTVQFGSRVLKGTVTHHNIEETSGLAVSRVHADVIYAHNDKGDSSRFYAININGGNKLATFDIRHAQNYDWEDMAVGPCADDCASPGACSAEVRPKRYCLYLADTGDHDGAGAMNKIYMVREPSVLRSGEVDLINTLQFSWTEQDAETLMIDPTGQLYVVSKIHGGRAVLAKIPSSAWGGPRVALDQAHSGTLKLTTSHNDPQGGDISPDGKEMLLVCEDDVYHYNVANLDYVKAVNSQIPQRIASYSREHSTEAIAWSPNGSGFYTLPEGKDEKLYFYPKIPTSPVIG
ncbi:uncharacterized protein LOC106013922 [Aplysia californica]|uniref:Uncharacterized protein LOC106013922 n=1 Tax=Aplysia californica TaxID=6500 RepID=A0ABM1AEP8_APLCA|nr:uncharacterized protein LOC106013922 [Aplysia californica]